ncbi:MAG: hypothetical protein C0609_05095, partial [Deltaproteobacteria bacterium]
MATNKSKIEKKALAFVQKGNYRKAALEYERLVADSPKDIRAHEKLLDLYLRIGKKEDAIGECKIVSDHYLAGGFIPRAIAAWKKCGRVDRENPDIYRNLGELYLKQKLVGDALNSFQRCAVCLRKADRPEEAASVLSMMEELAPKNPMIKLLLAEHHLQLEQYEEFKTHLDRAIGQLQESGRKNKLLVALENLYKKHNRPELIKPLAELYVNMGQHEHALEFIRDGLGVLPGDRGLRLDAINAHIALGNQDEARRMAHELYEENPADILIMEQLAYFAESSGNVEEQVSWYERLSVACRDQGQEVKAGRYEKKAKELAPQSEEPAFAFEGGEVDAVFDSLVTDDEPLPIDRSGFSEEELEDGLKEADLYLKYGLEDKAKEKLLELVEFDPENVPIHRKLRDIYFRRSEMDAWSKEQVKIAELLTSAGELHDAAATYAAVLEELPDNVQAKAGLAALTPDQKDEPGELKLDRTSSHEPEGADLQMLEVEPGGAEELLESDLGELEYDLASGIAGFEGIDATELGDIVKEFKAGV